MIELTVYGQFKCEVHMPNDVHTTHYLLLHTSFSMYRQITIIGKKTILNNILSPKPTMSIIVITYISNMPNAITTNKKESNLFIILSFNLTWFSIRSLERLGGGCFHPLKHPGGLTNRVSHFYIYTIKILKNKNKKSEAYVVNVVK